MNYVKQLEQEIKQKKLELKQARYGQAKKYRSDNPRKFRTLDIMIVIVIILNLGALLITNTLVVKDNPQKEFKEANPVQCKLNDFSCHNYMPGLITIFKQLIVWGLLVAGYMFLRASIHNNITYYSILIICLGWITIITFDFVNDLGYLIGVLIWR